MDVVLINKHKEDILKSLKDCVDVNQLEQLRINYLGKNGIITLLIKQISGLSLDKKKQVGKLLNNTRQEITKQIEEKKHYFEQIAIHQKLISEKIDLTLPPKPIKVGRIHPLTKASEEITTIFSSMGFTLVKGPEIEDDFHNFAALNIPAIHPARQMHDTFYMCNTNKSVGKLLRTHTSSVQIRTMKNNIPPFRIIAIDRCYRCDWDQTHTPMFHQVEGLVIDKNINMSHLKWCVNEFVRLFFEINDIPTRFRTSYFPFTEPSAEMDIGCSFNHNELNIGGTSEWMEILGCGMVHPQVLRNVNVDPEKYQGFAFGMGLERLAMLKYGIADLRKFFECDVRWLKNYGFKSFDIPSLIGGLTR